MKKIINILLVVASFVVISNCAGGGANTEEVVEENLPIVEVPKRYGVPIDGYKLESKKVLSGETMGDILSAYGKSAFDIDNLDKVSDSIFSLRKIRAGFDYTAFLSTDSLDLNHLDYIAYEYKATDYVLFSFVGDSISVIKGTKPTTLVRNVKSVEIKSSLWGAIMEEELPYTLAADLENVYQWSVDFFGIQKGDHFTVIYDEKFVDDSISVGVGQIWGAKFNHGSKDYFAIPYNQGGKIEFWDESGASLKKQMLKAPLKYSRISSRFSNARLHPIYKIYRPHHGVDYAAPAGTPVHAVADGVVTFKGWGGGGGNTLKIQHPNNIMTGYLHLSRYASGINQGTHVSQGDLIGYVGSTGASTGPHLDYRVWRNGVAINPLSIPQEPTHPISDDNKESYGRIAEAIMAELDGVATENQIIRDTTLLRKMELIDGKVTE